MTKREVKYHARIKVRKILYNLFHNELDWEENFRSWMKKMDEKGHFDEYKRHRSNIQL